MKLFIVLLLCLAVPSAFAQEPATLKLAKAIPLPEVRGRIDHFAIDAKGGRLFLAALGNNTLEILDVAAGKALKSVPGLRKPQGVVYLAGPNQIGVASGDDGKLVLFDGTSYELVKALPSLDDADNVRFDAPRKLIYVGYGDGALATVDPDTKKQTGSIKLHGHPESFQLEERGNRIFVNVPDAKQISIIDREKQAVTASWPMRDFQANFPMALDEANHRLLVGCRRAPRLVVLDTTTGAAVANLEISGDTDDLFYDAALKRIYISCGEGFVNVIDQRDADHYEMREKIRTRAGARTSFFSAQLNEFYLAVPRRGNDAAEVRVFRPQK